MSCGEGVLDYTQQLHQWLQISERCIARLMLVLLLLVSVFSRLAIEKTLSSKLEDARSSVQLRIVKTLKEYRNLYAVQHRLGDMVIFPEPLKFLPLYGLALCRSTPLRGGYADAPLDECCSAVYTMMTLPVKKLLMLLYPSLIRLDDYLLKVTLSERDNEMSRKLIRILKNLEKVTPHIIMCHLIRQGEQPREGFPSSLQSC